MMIVSAPSTTQAKWFIVRGWADGHEWGEEPPDPDDVFAVGDRVRLLGSTVEGIVQSSGEQPYNGGYLPFVLVWWDNKPFPTPTLADLLIRLTRYIPLGLTWKAPESFSNEQETKETCMQQAELPSKGTKVRVLKVRTRNLQQWVGHEGEITGVDGDKVYVNAGDGSEKKHLTLKLGWFEVVPVWIAQPIQKEEDFLALVYKAVPDFIEEGKSENWADTATISEKLGEQHDEVLKALEKLWERRVVIKSINPDNSYSWQKDQEDSTVQPTQFITSNFQVGDTVAPNWAAGRGRRGRIVNVVGKNQFQVDWADGTNSEFVRSAQPENDDSEVVRRHEVACRQTSAQPENDDSEVVRSAHPPENDKPFSITSTFIWSHPGKYWIDPKWVNMDLGTQCRVQTDQATVKYYASQMESSLWEWEASPVGLLWDGQQLIPYDGHHRLEAAMPMGKPILAQIDEGDLTIACSFLWFKQKAIIEKNTRG